MRILITNDDGVHAPGLVALVRVAREFGEVKIVAPDRERSACGHSMTMRDPFAGGAGGLGWARGVPRERCSGRLRERGLDSSLAQWLRSRFKRNQQRSRILDST